MNNKKREEKMKQVKNGTVTTKAETSFDIFFGKDWVDIRSWKRVESSGISAAQKDMNPVKGKLKEEALF